MLNLNIGAAISANGMTISMMNASDNSIRIHIAIDTGSHIGMSFTAILQTGVLTYEMTMPTSLQTSPTGPTTANARVAIGICWHIITDGLGKAGQDRAGQARARQGRAGQGRAGDT